MDVVVCFAENATNLVVFAANVTHVCVAIAMVR